MWRANPYMAGGLWQPGLRGGFLVRVRRDMAKSMSLSFLLTSLIVVASPGTGVLYTLAAALTRGSRASIAAAFGCTLGIVPHMLAAMFGLAAVLHTSAVAFAVLKWLGVVYLLVHGLAGAARARRARGRCATSTAVRRGG